MGRRLYTYSPTGGGSTLNLPLGTVTLTPRAPTLTITGGTSVTHNVPFGFAGTGFGTVGSRSILAYDTGAAAAGTIDPQWTNDNYPSTAGGVSNIQLQPTSFVSPSGFSPGAPDPFTSKIYAGCHLLTNTATGGNAVARSVRYTAPTRPYPWIAIYPYRADGNWTVDPKSDNNWKEMMYSLGPSMQPASGNFNYWCFADASTGNNNPFVISGITKAANAVITTTYNAATSPFAVGGTVYVDTVAGMTEINQTYVTIVAFARVSTFWTATVALDTTGFSTYTSGGGLWAPHLNTTVSLQTTTLGKQGTTGPMMQDPDLQTGKTGGFYNQTLWPMNSANGWIQKRWEWVVTTDTSVSSPGYEREYDNCVLTANYFGKSEFDDSGATTQRTITLGQYARDRGPNNFRYYGRTFVAVGGTGDTNVAHVMIGNAPTFAACTYMEYQPDTAWSDTSITITPWQGNFANGSTGYIYVYNRLQGEPTSPVATITWAGAAAVDFYISTTGNDANPGTKALPWSLGTLINPTMSQSTAQQRANQALMVGKRTAVLPGTYNCLSIVGGQYNTAGFGQKFDTPAFVVPPGASAAAPTILFCCDANGQQSYLTAILDGGMTDANNPGTQPLFGTQLTTATKYITIDGFEIKNANDRLFSAGAGTTISPTTRAPGLTFQNIYAHHIVSTTNAANAAAFTIYDSDGVLLSNCYATDVVNSNNRNSGIEMWGCINDTVDMCTVRQIAAGSSGIFFKNTGQFNVTLKRSFVDMSGAPPSPNGNPAVNWDLSGNATNTSKIVNCAFWAVQPLRCDGISIAQQNSTENQQYINNTLIGTATTNIGMFVALGAAGTQTIYNNIISRTVTGSRGDMNLNTSSAALIDYNCYHTTPQLCLTANGSAGTPGSTFTTLATWGAALPASCVGKDAHSVLTTNVAFTGTGTGAQQFQLTAGSPCKNTGSANGQTGGAAIDMGAWGNGNTQVGAVINGIYQ